jgi:hypothetical protein
VLPATTLTRDERHAQLVEDLDAGHDRLDEIGRYAGIQQQSDWGYYVVTGDSFENIADYLAEEVFEGWSPAGIVDLDTGESIGVHVSTPVVSRSEDPGAAMDMPWER